MKHIVILLSSQVDFCRIWRNLNIFGIYSVCHGKEMLTILENLTGQSWFSNLKGVIKKLRGAWVAQSVKRLASAQVMISQSVSSSPTSGFVLTAQSLEPASDCVPLSLCPSLTHALSPFLSRINKTLKKMNMAQIKLKPLGPIPCSSW